MLCYKYWKLWNMRRNWKLKQQNSWIKREADSSDKNVQDLTVKACMLNIIETKDEGNTIIISKMQT